MWSSEAERGFGNLTVRSIASPQSWHVQPSRRNTAARDTFE
jgi:hypothetical protein